MSTQRVIKKGCLGAGVFDWYIGCKDHNTASGEFFAWCLSCRFTANHNEKIKKQLDRLEWEALVAQDA